MREIVIFLPDLNGGGAERVMLTLANALSARGFKVDLVLVTARGPYLMDVSPLVNVVDLKAGRAIKALLPLVRYIRRESPGVILSAMGHVNVVALLARKLAMRKTRVVVSVHGLMSGEYSIARGILARMNYFIIPFLYRWADGICSVSYAASKDLAHFARIPLQKVKTIYNPFDIGRIRRLSEEALENSWFLPGQPPVIVAIGRLNEAKDFTVLVRAFAQLRQQREVRLVILGEGELRRDLEALVEQLGLDSNTVLLPGFVENPYAWLARCSLFVLSSRREGLPGALIEAMACGAPVVSTNCLSGPDEILEGGRWGRLVPVGDVNALVHAMAATLDTPMTERPDVRKRAADFEQERAVDAYLQLLGLPMRPGTAAIVEQ